jgi:hypothetical protein
MSTKKTDTTTPSTLKSAKSKGEKIVVKKKKQKKAHDPFDAFIAQFVAQQEAQAIENMEADFFHMQTVWAGQLLLRTHTEIFQSPYLAHMCTAFATDGDTNEGDLDRLNHLTQQEFGCALDEIEVPPRMLAEAGLICQDCLAGLEH